MCVYIYKVTMCLVVSFFSVILPMWNSSINSPVFVDGLMWPTNAPMPTQILPMDG